MPFFSDHQHKFFMTRQAANVLEDLDRQLEPKGSICLIFGADGVGKSRLLEYFVEHRLSREKTLSIKLLADNKYQLNTNDSPVEPQAGLLAQVFKTVDNGSYIILDQFEQADESLQSQWLLFWSTHAVTKDLKLVLSGTDQAARSLSAIATRFALSVHAVELKILSRSEQIDFLSACYCSSHSQQLRLNTELKSVLKSTEGLYSNLISLNKNSVQLLQCEESSNHSHINYTPWVVLLILLSVVLSGLVILDFSQTKSVDSTIKAESDNQALAVLDNEEKIKSEQINRPLLSENVSENTALMNANDAPGPLAVNVLIEDEPEELNSIKAEYEALPALLSERFLQQAEVSNVEELGADSLLEQRISATRLWLEESSQAQASIQIMTLYSSDQAKKSLSDYLHRLSQKNIQMDKLYIYTSGKSKTEIFAVLYGSFESRQDAVNAIEKLPAVLNSDGPIPRTIKGIRQEINS